MYRGVVAGMNHDNEDVEEGSRKVLLIVSQDTPRDPEEV